jgi:hypothetical protein
MFTNKELDEMKDALPYKGIHLIHSRTGVSRPTIYKFFEGKDVGLSQMEKIWKEGWTIIRELKEKRAELKKHAQEVINFKC